MKIFFQTLGCKVNQYETQAMEGIFHEKGWEIVEKPEDAQVCVINTCAVTAESERKSRQAVRQLKKKSPDCILAVCGCSSQVSPDVHASLGADVVFGSGDRLGLVDAIEKTAAERAHIRRIDEALKRRSFEILPAGGLQGRTRAMLKIQDGCSNFCSYCIIPFSRGPSRSMPLEPIREEAKRLQAEGYREIVVTGIEIASYGRDFKDGTTLADAISAICESAPRARIRLGSLEPRVITEEFCQMAAKYPNLCGHFHLSLQSGCDKTLHNMRRKYDTARFYESVCLLRKYFPGCAIAVDLITGFPGETPDDHRETLQFMEKCRFADMHIFPYSIRPGTKAADLADQVEKAEKARRAAEATKIAQTLTAEYLEGCVGQTLRVLFETEKDGYSFGHGENYCRVAVKAKNLHNCVADVQITGKNGDLLLGILPL